MTSICSEPHLHGMVPVTVDSPEKQRGGLQRRFGKR
jgi:hypothetical protein